jgi:2-polyprenyl-3-methyl-5-hydroxy-6-metoxy-1,4-benzoquinol methylase
MLTEAKTSVQTKCPACESETVQSRFAVPDHEYNLAYQAQYARCRECSSYFQSPMPDLNQLSGFYPANYHSFDTDSILSKLKHRQRLRRLRSFVGSDAITLLDYGCGSGAFIKGLARHMPHGTFYGYDINSTDVKEVLAEGRVILLKGSFDYLLNELPLCDVITLNHVIEHLPDPHTVLSTLRQKLKPDAVIEGQTPAADSLEQRVFGKQWSGFHAPRHTVVFSRKGLMKILKRAGFVESHVTPAFNPAGIAISLTTIPQGNSRGHISRKGFSWLFCVALATLLYPVDLLSRAPGMVNFSAQAE